MISPREKRGSRPAILKPADAMDNGAVMRGVTSYPFDPSQSAYVEEFAPIVAASLVHPYNAITETNADSMPHNIITGSAFVPPTQHHSEYKREYAAGLGGFNISNAPTPRLKPWQSNADPSLGLSARTKFPGLRSEEMITVGQYTPVLRTYT